MAKRLLASSFVRLYFDRANARERGEAELIDRANARERENAQHFRGWHAKLRYDCDMTGEEM